MTKKAKIILVLLCLCLLSVFAAACDTQTHTHTADDVWHTDASSHWHECTEDGEKMDEAAHTAGTEWKSDGTNHWQECTVCGAKMNETAHTPDAAGWHTDGTNHWHECGVCNAVYDEQEHTNSGYQSDSEKHWAECSICGAEYGEGAHTPSTEYESDGTNHWHPCVICGEPMETEEHTPGSELLSDGITQWYECTECGERSQETSHTHEYKLNEDGTGLICWCNTEKDIDRFAIADRLRIELGLSVENGAVAEDSTTSLSIDLTAADTDPALNGFNVSSVVCGSSALDEEDFTVSGEALTFTPSAFGLLYGEQTLVFRFMNADEYVFEVEVPVLLVSQVITTAAQLSQFGTIAKACEADQWTYGGYFELGANITNAGTMTEFLSYASATSNQGHIITGNYGFKGVFDGRGYAIDGLTKSSNVNDGAFIGYLHKDGVIRNVSFTNAVYNSMTGSFVVNGGGGLVENVYVQYNQFSFGATWREPNSTFYGHNYNTNANNAGAVVRNCVVEFAENSVSLLGSNILLDWVALAAPSDRITVENLYVILPDQGGSDATARGKVFGTGTSGDTYNVYTSYDGLKTAVSDWSDWNSDIWDTSAGYPVFKERPEGNWMTDGTQHWHMKGEEQIDVGTHTDSGWQYDAESHWKVCDVCGYKVAAEEAHSPSDDYQSDGTYHWFYCTQCGMELAKEEHTPGGELQTDGDTEWYECSVCHMHLNEVPHEHQYQLNEDGTMDVCWCGDEKPATSYEIADRARIELGLSVGSGGAVVEDSQTSLTLDLSAAESGLDSGVYNVSRAICGDVELDFEDFAVSGETLTFTPSAFGLLYGEQMLVLTFINEAGSGFEIEVPVLLVSQVITTATELSQFGTIAKACEADQWTYGGYFELGNDIQNAGTMTEFLSYTSATGNSGYIVTGNYGFKGVFDGCGYAIDGLTKQGNANNGAFIGYLHKDGVIRNVSFTNAVYSSGISGSFVVNGGGGLVENVYVQYANFTFGAGWAEPIGTFYAHNENSNADNAGAVLKNCIVEFAANSVVCTNEISLGKLALVVPSNRVTVENLYVILPDQGDSDATARGKVFGTGTSGDTYNVYTSYDELKTAVSDWSGWSSDIWDTSAGYPVFRDKTAA